MLAIAPCKDSVRPVLRGLAQADQRRFREWTRDAPPPFTFQSVDEVASRAGAPLQNLALHGLRQICLPRK
jgi:hypothetical protein